MSLWCTRGRTGIGRHRKSLLRANCLLRSWKKDKWHGKEYATRQKTGYRQLGKLKPLTPPIIKARTRFISRSNGRSKHSYGSYLVPSVRNGPWFCLMLTSSRCSPSQWVGPARFTQPPCPISSLPPIDIVIISQFVPLRLS